MRESDDQFFTYKNDGFHYCAVYSISIWGADGQSDTRPFSVGTDCSVRQYDKNSDWGDQE